MTQFQPLANAAQNDYEQIQRLIDASPGEKGIEALLGFLASYPDYPVAHNDIAVLYFRQGDKLRALAHYEKAVRLAPGNLTFRRNLADFYFSELGWTDDAILIYTDILGKQPTDAEALEALGAISLAVGRAEEARIFFKRILDINPGNSSVRNILEQLETPAPGPPSAGRKSAETSATELDTILSGLRETLSSMEATTAVDMYRKAERLASQGDSEAAIRELESLLAIEPSNSLAYNDLGVLYYRKGDLRKSLELHETAVSLNRSNPTFRKNLANLYYQELQRTDEAIQIYVDLLRERPNDTEVLGALAVISIANNRPDEASIFLKRILDLEPSNAEARTILDQLDDNPSFFLTPR